jgi:hypothetical protein
MPNSDYVTEWELKKAKEQACGQIYLVFEKLTAASVKLNAFLGPVSAASRRAV